ncbi:hypothetical protein C8E89_10986 [Mycolicibacterium moriokaense]|uniref:Uncharacterized protein n=1 Tax=Mycolicibacterium moriokaense TaxID=39691 RepID=A0A318HKI9_9MYCO|nr:hypothetical protein C8E89_10986 [Mycolicibacterium moriokaense]
MEWSEVKTGLFKLVAAGTGALTVVFSDAPGSIGQGPEVTLGETTTSTTAPAELATSIASPTLTAHTPDGFAKP